jgi:tellurite resistance-related uncharacterized protein
MSDAFVQHIHLPVHRTPERQGCLLSLDMIAALPFDAVRVFWVDDIHRGDRRAGHANTIVHEAIACLRGAVRVIARYAGATDVTVLDDPAHLAVFPPGTWIDIEVLRDDSLYLVIASHDFATAQQQYVRDAETFDEPAR